MELLITSNCL